jgi:hypothetical protein
VVDSCTPDSRRTHGLAKQPGLSEYAFNPPFDEGTKSSQALRSQKQAFVIHRAPRSYTVVGDTVSGRCTRVVNRDADFPDGSVPSIRSRFSIGLWRLFEPVQRRGPRDATQITTSLQML